MIDPIVPAAIFILGGALVPFFKGRAKSAYMVLLPVVGFLNLTHLPMGFHHSFAFGDLSLSLMHVDRLNLVFGYIYIRIQYSESAILAVSHLDNNAVLVSSC